LGYGITPMILIRFRTIKVMAYRATLPVPPTSRSVSQFSDGFSA
jgi:hypothetical protein